MNCYLVELKTTNALKSTAEVDGDYIDVQDGHIYCLAKNLEEVAEYFPEALFVKKVGLGYIPPTEDA